MQEAAVQSIDLPGTEPLGADPLDALIVGAGPAGLTAALYLARFRRRLLLVDAGDSRARYIPVSHNTPGYARGVSGKDLLAELREQAARYGAEPVPCTIRRIVRTADGFRTRVGDRDVDARHVLLATGVVDTLPAIAGIERAIHAGRVRLCAVCDGYETEGLRVAVYGPPAQAASHACFMRAFCAEVSALVDAGAAVAPDTRRTLAQAGVRLVADVTALSADEHGIEVRRGNGEPERFDALYPVLGATKRCQLATDLGARTDADGELEVDAHQQTSVSGLYAIGDVVSGLNQISVAVGHAALAATAVHNRLPMHPLDGT